MKAFVLLPLLPIVLIRNIQQFIAHDAVNTIIRAYYRKMIFKIRLADYFCSIRCHIFRYGYYKVNILPTFVNNLKLVCRFINEFDDYAFWCKVYINIHKTLSYEQTLGSKSIISSELFSTIYYLCNNLRLSLGGCLTYHY